MLPSDSLVFTSLFSYSRALPWSVSLLVPVHWIRNRPLPIPTVLASVHCSILAKSVVKLLYRLPSVFTLEGRSKAVGSLLSFSCRICKWNSISHTISSIPAFLFFMTNRIDGWFLIPWPSTLIRLHIRDCSISQRWYMNPRVIASSSNPSWSWSITT